jgi:cytochrome P450
MGREALKHEPLPASAAINWWGMLTDPEFLKSPYSDLKRIRELGPVHYDAASGVYFVLGHSEFRLMATAPEMGRDTRLWNNGWNTPENKRRDPLSYALFSEFQPQMTNVNAPDHRRMRDVYEKAFGSADLAMYVPMIEAECRQLLDAIPVDAPIDFMSEFANPLVRRVARNLFDIPAEMEGQVAHWVAALSLLGNVMMTPSQKREAQTALRQFKAYLRERFFSRILGRREGFVGLALAAFEDGTMSEDESLNNLVALIAGGVATAALLGNGMLTLLLHPAQLEKLRANGDLMRPAIEEMLRFEPGGSFILRVAIRDFQCGEVAIPAGSLAIGLVAAINRDPSRFDEPDVFDITRKHNPHCVFGSGPHICIGKALVRMTAQAAFRALLDRFQRIELSSEPIWWTHRSDQHGLENLPLELGHAQ